MAEVKPDDFKLILVDLNEELCEAWSQQSAGLDKVQIAICRFEELSEFDCMVSAANSFGLMDGGVDLAIVSFFGMELMDRVQNHILEHFRGEQPVGTSFIVETGHSKHPFLAHTPTMRTPMPISRTDNVYVAMWAMLVAVWNHNKKESRKIRSVACPGLGTATGGVSAQQAARLMLRAYRHFLDPPKQISWPYAEARQSAIGLGGDRSFA